MMYYKYLNARLTQILMVLSLACILKATIIDDISIAIPFGILGVLGFLFTFVNLEFFK